MMFTKWSKPNHVYIFLHFLVVQECHCPFFQTEETFWWTSDCSKSIYLSFLWRTLGIWCFTNRQLFVFISLVIPFCFQLDLFFIVLPTENVDCAPCFENKKYRQVPDWKHQYWHVTVWLLVTEYFFINTCVILFIVKVLVIILFV